MASKNAQNVPATIKYPAFSEMLRVGGASSQALTGGNDPNTVRAIWQVKLNLGGQEFAPSYFRTGSDSEKCYAGNPSAVLEALMHKDTLAPYVMKSLGFSILVAIQVGMEKQLPKEFELSTGILGAIAKYQGHKGISDLIVTPKAKTARAGTVSDDVFAGMWGTE